MYLRLERIEHVRNCWRWYVLSIQRTLFDEWALIREWGRIGQQAGQSRTSLFETEEAALSALHEVRQAKARRGYASIPEQLDLPF